MKCEYCGCLLPDEYRPNCKQCGGPTKESRIEEPVFDQVRFADSLEDFTDADGTELELHGEGGPWIPVTGEIGIIHDYVYPDCRCAWTEPVGEWGITSNAADD